MVDLMAVRSSVRELLEIEDRKTKGAEYNRRSVHDGIPAPPNGSETGKRAPGKPGISSPATTIAPIRRIVPGIPLK
jgi:hypothetical protein